MSVGKLKAALIAKGAVVVHETGEELFNRILQKRSYTPPDLVPKSEFEKLVEKGRPSDFEALLAKRDFKPADYAQEVIGKGKQTAWVMTRRAGEAEFAKWALGALAKYEANLLDVNPWLKALEVGADVLEGWSGAAAFPAPPSGDTYRDGDLTFVNVDGAIWYTAPQPELIWPYPSLPGNEPGTPSGSYLVFPGWPQDQYWYGKYIGPGTFGGWYYGPSKAIPEWHAGKYATTATNLVPSAAAGADRESNRNIHAAGRYRWLTDQGFNIRRQRTHTHAGGGGDDPPRWKWRRRRPPPTVREGKFILTTRSYKVLYTVAQMLGEAAELIDLFVGASSGRVVVIRALDGGREETYGFKPRQYGPGHRKYFAENKYLGFRYKPWLEGGIEYQKAKWFIDGGWRNFNLDKFVGAAIYNEFEDKILGAASRSISGGLTPPGRGFSIIIGPAV